MCNKQTDLIDSVAAHLRRKDRIAITPEMIDAGFDVLLNYDPAELVLHSRNDPDAVIARICEAMRQASGRNSRV